MKLMQLVFMLSQFDANSYTYLCARVKDRTYVTLVAAVGWLRGRVVGSRKNSWPQ